MSSNASTQNLCFNQTGQIHVPEFVNIITPATGATTLTVGQSGSTIKLNIGAAQQAITLPAVAAATGVKYKFVLGTGGNTSSATITAGAANIKGICMCNSALVACAGITTITFAQNTAIVGDFVELESNGTNWTIFAMGSAAGAITFA